MSQPLSLSTSIAYLHDNFVKFSDANISIASSPVLYGLAVYTVFSANWNSGTEALYLFRIRDHYNRLVRAARIMDFSDVTSRFEFDQFRDLMFELIRRNNVKEDALIRCTLYVDELAAGTRIHGLANDFAAYIYPMGEILPRNGVRVCVSSWTRTTDNAIPSRAKLNGSYINASLMKNEALLNGFDEALALDANGQVTEGTVANVFFVRDGALYTPDTSSDILEGITRSTVIKLARNLGLSVFETPLDRSFIYTADEAFFVGSSARLTPILSIDHRPFTSGPEGPITAQLVQAFRTAQDGSDSKFHSWLTRVPAGHTT